MTSEDSHQAQRTHLLRCSDMWRLVGVQTNLLNHLLYQILKNIRVFQLTWINFQSSDVKSTPIKFGKLYITLLAMYKFHYSKQEIKCQNVFTL